MISNTSFCIMFKGMPIEGFSSNNGYPIFVAHPHTIPSWRFQTPESASESLSIVLLGHLERDNPLFDISDLSIGHIQIDTRELYKVSAYDEVFNSVLKNNTSKPYIDFHIGMIIHECVRKGFKKTLPINYQRLIESSEFSEVFDKNVPFFVQQNIERFMDVGINTCTPDEIAAIILTSSDELLKAIHIDSLNNVSK